jgi:hypothetical protein
MVHFGTIPVLRNGEHGCAVYSNHLLFNGDFKMTKYDQELLEKQLWGASSRPSQNGTIILTIVAVFLAGIGIGDILSKTKQANTIYAAAIPRITDALP